MENKEKGKYTKSEKYFKAKENQVKVSQYDDTNLMLTTFCESGEVTNKSSLAQYKSAIRRCEEKYSKPIIDVTLEEVEEYAKASSDKEPTVNAQRNYIKGFIRFWILEEIKNGNKAIVNMDKFLNLFMDNRTGITVELAKSFLL